MKIIVITIILLNTIFYRHVTSCILFQAINVNWFLITRVRNEQRSSVRSFHVNQIKLHGTFINVSISMMNNRYQLHVTPGSGWFDPDQIALKAIKINIWQFTFPSMLCGIKSEVVLSLYVFPVRLHNLKYQNIYSQVTR